jgi:hypothetical protein
MYFHLDISASLPTTTFANHVGRDRMLYQKLSFEEDTQLCLEAMEARSLAATSTNAQETADFIAYAEALEFAHTGWVDSSIDVPRLAYHVGVRPIPVLPSYAAR